MTGPDFRPDGLQPAHAHDDLTAGGVRDGDLTVLAEHHAEGPEQASHLIAHDASAPWAGPGADQLVAIHITRDMDRRSFTFDTRRHATLAFAQKWLIQRGCPLARRVGVHRALHRGRP
ncbi:hypothetical protein [Actinacidiphila acididurans]|uniref:Uncharacterized protein n=1 Tax=Actinacidiphila acididurans TaxID=2784346 RepID=A0ABS2TU56_9ACTN|nr:hypothetical protein [Actinacidiphila acididurans]MBM9506856.1 hypothetical protein [Actinacidiphila acididurans]